MVRHPRVLVVDDDPDLRESLRYALEQHGLQVHQAADARTALIELKASTIDIAVVDVAMPGMSGVDLVRLLRSDGNRIPVCMLSARDEVDDRVAGLAAGADDYVVKPFSAAELAARLHALIKLNRTRGGLPLTVGDLVVEPDRREARRAGRELDLTAREFDLLLAFAAHPGQVLSRTQLLAQVWGYTWDVDSNVVDVFVGYLRRKLEADGKPRLVHTVRGVGFVLRRP